MPLFARIVALLMMCPQVTIDATPPIIDYVRDSFGTGVRFLLGPTDPDVIAATSLDIGCLFSSRDQESGIREAVWCLGSFPGACNVIPPRSVDASLRETHQSVGNLIDGGFYYPLLTVLNYAGNWQSAWSDGFVVDVSAPNCGVIMDGAGVDRQFVGPTLLEARFVMGDDNQIAALGTMRLTWDGFTDAYSGVAGYAAAIVPAGVLGVADGNSSDVGFTDVGLGSSASFFLAVTHGVTYHGIVSVWDALRNERKCYSNGVLYDETPPITVNATLESKLSLNELNVQRYTHMINADVNGIYDPESGVRQYFVAVGSATDPSSVADFQSVGASLGEIVLGGLEMPQGEHFVTVRAVNNAKEMSDVSMAIGVDTTPPNCSPITINNNIPGQRMQYTEETSRLNASWTCVDAAPWEGRPLSCRWAVGSFPGGEDLMPFRMASHSGRHMFECGGCLENGLIYYVSLECTDQVGLSRFVTSGGLMPDLTVPEPAIPATVVTRFTGRATTFWGSGSDISLLYGFDDLESGIKSVRAAFSHSVTSFISGPTDIAGFLAMPIELPVGDGQSHAVAELAQQGLTLQHGAYYSVHVCAEDWMDHVACSTPYSFLVDLTPPICKRPHDLIAGMPAPTYFSTRAGYASKWECHDPESGVLFSSWMAYGDNVPLLTRKVRQLSGLGSRAVAIPRYFDGAYYHSCVTASNGAELSSFELCSPGTTHDPTPPYADGSMFDEDGRGFRTSIPELCTTIPPMKDGVSGVSELSLGFFEQLGGTLILNDEPIALDRSALQGGVICRNVTMASGRRYLSRLVSLNGATPPLVSQVRSQGFFTDDTPPSAGQARLRMLFPRGFEDQPDFPASLVSLVVRVRSSGFLDDESGIAFYEIRLLADGIEVDSGTFRRYAPFYETPSLPRMNNGTVLQALVRAVNPVGLQGPWSSSPERILTLGVIDLNDPWFATGFGRPQTSTVSHLDAMMSVGLQFAKDPMDAGAIFEYMWGISAAPCDDEDASPSLTTKIGLESGILSSAARRSHAYSSLYAATRPWSQDMIRTGHMLPGTERNTVWATSFQSARLPAGQYCVLVEACTRATYAPDGELILDARCANATSSPMTFDNTPPVAWTGRFQPVNSSNGAWPMQAAFACEDAESGISTAYLSLGSVDAPGLVVDSLALNVTLNENGTILIGQPNITGIDGIFIDLANTSGFWGEVVISQTLLEGVELGYMLRASLTCENALLSLSQSTSHTRVDFEPPTIVFTHLRPLVWSEEEQAWLLTPDTQSISLKWAVTDLTLSKLTVCVTTSIEQGCNVEAQELQGNATGTMLNQMLSHPSSASSTRFFVTITAVDEFGMSSTDELVVISDHSPPIIGNLTVGSFSDLTEGDLVESLSLTAAGLPLLNDSLVRLELLGGAFDDDLLDSPLTVEWEHRMASGELLGCSYTRQGENWTWAARCSIASSAEVCFTARARSVMGLVSKEVTGCISIGVTAPEWTVAPTLARTAEGWFNASWQLPTEMLGGRTSIEWLLCTQLSCSDATGVPRWQLFTLIPPDHPHLSAYEGAVWVLLRASPVGSSGWARSISPRTCSPSGTASLCRASSP